jgi:hypothetical protein
VARLDVETVPVVLVLEAGLAGDEKVDAAGGILFSAAVCEDLDLVTDVGWRAIGIVIGTGQCVLGARGVANGYTAIAARWIQVFGVKIEFIEIDRGVEPGLRPGPGIKLFARDRSLFERVVVGALAKEGAVFENGPGAVTTDFPAVEILAVEEGVPVLGGEEGGGEEEQSWKSGHGDDYRTKGLKGRRSLRYEPGQEMAWPATGWIGACDQAIRKAWRKPGARNWGSVSCRRSNQLPVRKTTESPRVCCSGFDTKFLKQAL